MSDDDELAEFAAMYETVYDPPEGIPTPPRRTCWQWIVLIVGLTLLYLLI
jgi:hypothetical protein